MLGKGHPIDLAELIQEYNALAKEIPEKINAAYKKAQKPGQVVVASGGSKCGKCQKPLAGNIVEVFGVSYHSECFGCFQCGKSLQKSCLNIDNKPYCERCGKQAFVQSRLKGRS